MSNENHFETNQKVIATMVWISCEYYLDVNGMGGKEKDARGGCGGDGGGGGAF